MSKVVFDKDRFDYDMWSIDGCTEMSKVVFDKDRFDYDMWSIYGCTEHDDPATRTADGGSPAYRVLLDAAWQLHIAKNAGYAGHSADPWANFRQCEAFGITAADGVLTRMSDKWSRLQSLWQNPERDMVGESIEDTLKDLSAYALILVCLLQEAE